MRLVPFLVVGDRRRHNASGSVSASSAGSKVRGRKSSWGLKEPPRLEAFTQRGGETTPDVSNVSGSVKWFDPSKGYGFIVPDEDIPDILLHVSCLRRGGFQTACEGARVVCEVDQQFKGPAGRPHLQHGRFDVDPPIAVARKTPGCRRPRERLGKSGGEVVLPTTRVWLCNPWSPDARYFCAYGNPPAIRLCRAQAWPHRACALRPKTKRSHRRGT